MHTGNDFTPNYNLPTLNKPTGNRSMNIAILHYHLNRGGVTRVITNQLLALDSALENGQHCRVAILYGGEAAGFPDEFASRLNSIQLMLCDVPGLGYDDCTLADTNSLAVKLREQLRQLKFEPPDTLLHVHNHCLGKNASLPGALLKLARDGFPLLLQIHDFAEDFRPDNYRLLSESLGADGLAASLYPQAARIHYAALNRRDETALQRAGVADERRHWLPNPVPELSGLPDRKHARDRLQQTFGIPHDHRYVIYPVRGIRRKNLGELLLWSALADAKTDFALTLAPMNPIEQVRYREWTALATELQLPLHFDTGGEGGLSFEENLMAADLILTTSVAEGFGMVFLESWLAGRPLTGRNLPEISIDFTESGLKLEHLYSQLNVPIAWIDRDDYVSTGTAAYASVTESFNRRPLEAASVEEILNANIADGCMDFGDLSESLQASVIRRVHDDEAARNEIRQLNPAIDHALSAPLGDWTGLIEHNRQVIGEQYSFHSSGRRLLELDNTVLASRRDDAIQAPDSPESILDGFLDLNRFRLIRG